MTFLREFRPEVFRPEALDPAEFLRLGFLKIKRITSRIKLIYLKILFIFIMGSIYFI